MIGLGDQNASFRVYVENRPKMPQYQQLFDCEAMQKGDIDLIYQHCGNGWRKLFNVYAKLLCVLDPTRFPSRLRPAAGSSIVISFYYKKLQTQLCYLICRS